MQDHLNPGNIGKTNKFQNQKKNKKKIKSSLVITDRRQKLNCEVIL